MTTQNKIKLLSLRQLAENAENCKTEYLVEDLLPLPSVNHLIGKPKSGKSTLLRQLAVAVSTGSAFLGRPTIKGAVLYLAFEEQNQQLAQHFKTLSCPLESGIHVTTDRVDGDPLAGLRNTLTDYAEVKLIMIDPLFKFVRVKDSNDYAEVGAKLDPLTQLAKEFNVAIVCAHHQKKRETEDVGDGALGSTAIRASSDTNIYLRQDRSGARTLQTEQRYGSSMEETRLEFDAVTRSFSLGMAVSAIIQDQAENARRRLQNELTAYIDAHPGATQQEVLEAVTGRTDTKLRILHTLANNGLLCRKRDEEKNGSHIYFSGEIPTEGAA